MKNGKKIKIFGDPFGGLSPRYARRTLTGQLTANMRFHDQRLLHPNFSGAETLHICYMLIKQQRSKNVERYQFRGAAADTESEGEKEEITLLGINAQSSTSQQ